MQIWDAGTGQGFSQYTEHQKRAWSVDFSPSDPTKFVSGSDDCSVKLWSVNEVRFFPLDLIILLEFLFLCPNYNIAPESNGTL